MPIGILLSQVLVLKISQGIICVLCYGIGKSQIKSKGPDSVTCVGPLLNNERGRPDVPTPSMKEQLGIWDLVILRVSSLIEEFCSSQVRRRGLSMEPADAS
jgi:hypothetical protein